MNKQTVRNLVELFKFDLEKFDQTHEFNRLPVIWINAQDCTGCSETFVRGMNFDIAHFIFDVISLTYMDILSYTRPNDLGKKNQGEYVLIVEGSLGPHFDYCFVGGKCVADEVKELAEHAKYIIAVGSCSCWGGIPAAKPNPTEAVDLQEILPDREIIRVPGCPPLPEAIYGTLLYLWLEGKTPPLTRKGTPTFFYDKTVHETCHRKHFFDQKLFAEHFDDPNGYCLLKLGCKGPTAFNGCETIKWNGGISSPIFSGNACLGCSEKNFWDKYKTPVVKKRKAEAK